MGSPRLTGFAGFAFRAGGFFFAFTLAINASRSALKSCVVGPVLCPSSQLARNKSAINIDIALNLTPSLHA